MAPDKSYLLSQFMRYWKPLQNLKKEEKKNILQRKRKFSEILPDILISGDNCSLRWWFLKDSIEEPLKDNVESGFFIQLPLITYYSTFPLRSECSSGWLSDNDYNPLVKGFLSGA